MLSTLRRLAFLALAVALVPSAAGAQTVALADLAGYIKPGDIVSLTDTGGQEVKGKVATLTASSLTLQLDAETRDFPEAAIRRIVVRDRLWTGALIGAAAGAVPGTMLGFGFKSWCENESSSCPAAPLVSGVLFGAAGAAIGAGIDGLIHRSYDVSRRQGTSLTVSPVAGPDRQGILVSIRF